LFERAVRNSPVQVIFVLFFSQQQQTATTRWSACGLDNLATAACECIEGGFAGSPTLCTTFLRNWQLDWICIYWCPCCVCLRFMGSVCSSTRDCAVATQILIVRKNGKKTEKCRQRKNIEMKKVVQKVWILLTLQHRSAVA